jgi:DNA-binding PadR family transcriptional regulator
MSREEAASPEPVLLGFLMSGPAHPYELRRRFDQGLGRVWRVGQSHLYAYLKRIEAEGFATVEVEEQEDRPSRNVYSLTAKGRKRFLEWLRSPAPHMRNLRLELLARLYFFRELGLEGQDELLARQREVIEERRASIKRAMEEAEDGYWRLVLDFRLSEMEAVIAWLGRCSGA